MGLTLLDAENHLAKLRLVENISKFIITLLVGKLSDLFKLWKVMTFINTITLAGSVIMIADMLAHSQDGLS